MAETRPPSKTFGAAGRPARPRFRGSRGRIDPCRWFPAWISLDSRRPGTADSMRGTSATRRPADRSDPNGVSPGSTPAATSGRASSTGDYRTPDARACSTSCSATTMARRPSSWPRACGGSGSARSTISRPERWELGAEPTNRVRSRLVDSPWWQRSGASAIPVRRRRSGRCRVSSCDRSRTLDTKHWFRSWRRCVAQPPIARPLAGPTPPPRSPHCAATGRVGADVDDDNVAMLATASAVGFRAHAARAHWARSVRVA